MSWIDQRPDDAMDGAFTVVGPEPLRTVDAGRFPRGDEPARRRRARHHHRRPWRQGRRHRHRGVLGFGRAADAADVPQPPQPDQSGGAWRTACSASTRSAPARRRSPISSPGAPACSGSDRFATGEWSVLSTGSPVLTSAVIAFDCRIIEVRSVGSHNVFFGAVEAVRLGPKRPGAGLSRACLQAGVSSGSAAMISAKFDSNSPRSYCSIQCNFFQCRRNFLHRLDVDADGAGRSCDPSRSRIMNNPNQQNPNQPGRQGQQQQGGNQPGQQGGGQDKPGQHRRVATSQASRAGTSPTRTVRADQNR